MKKKLLVIVSLLLTACLASGCAYMPGLLMGDMLTTSGSTSATTTVSSGSGDTVTISREEYERYQQFDVLIELMDMAELYYYEEVDTQAMLDGAANGLLQGLGDPYTFYYTPEEFAELWEEDEGEYAGVGIQISTSYVTGLCTVSRVFDNGPAREAGIHKGDILYMVGDMYVNSSTINDAVEVMRGEPGTDVTVTVLRGTEELTFTLTRTIITVNRIESCMLADGVGYIVLYEFAGDCSAEFEKHLKALEAQGMQGLIIDLRDNPGGWVDDAETIADLFLDKGTLCYLEYKDGSREYYRTRTDSDDRLGFPLVILVNENSASSSEILTGALKDRADATVVGVQSYGKGIVQSVVTLDGGAGMQMTVAQYYTPNGNAVHKLGITPDVEIHLEQGDNGMYEFGDLSDPQLAKALEVMQEKLAK